MTTVYPTFIISRDRLAALKRLVTWLVNRGQTEIYILDNDSQYPPLLEYLNTQTDAHVLHFDNSHGYMVAWNERVIERYARGRRFILTDADMVPCDDCPDDALDYLAGVLDKSPTTLKVGLGLRLDDIPDCYRHKQRVVEYELQFWRYMDDDIGAYWAACDTTFAMYQGTTTHGSTFPAMRGAPPYLAWHTPYYIDSANPDEEERFYFSRAVGTHSGPL